MTNLPATPNFAPRLDVDGNAPPLKVDVFNPHLTLDDVLPDNFISMEGLQRWLDERNAESRVLTTAAVTMELLYDPGRGEKPADGEWKPVLWFDETESGLVINKTRGQQLTDLAQSPLLARWAKIGKVALKVGVFNGKAQIGIVRIPAGDEPAEEGNGNGKRKLGIDALR